MIGKVATALATACAGLLWIACNTCPFAIAQRLRSEGTVPCCGASVHFDVTVQDVDDLEVDLASTEFPGQTQRVDAWLTRTTCDALFDATYPTGTPRCETLIGPVAPGAVSTRLKVDPGRYRVFLQAYQSNTVELRYDADVGVWGRSCRSTPVGP